MFFDNANKVALINKYGLAVTIHAQSIKGIVESMDYQLFRSDLVDRHGRDIILLIDADDITTPPVVGDTAVVLGGDYVVATILNSADPTVWRLFCTEAIPVVTDTTPPARVVNFSLKRSGTNHILRCTAPGDDGDVGTAAFVAVKWKLADPFNDESEWTAGTDFIGEMTDPPAGTPIWYDNGVASGSEWTLTFPDADDPSTADIKYLAIRFKDAAGNIGAISNCAIMPASS